MQSHYIDLRPKLWYDLVATKVVQPKWHVDIKSNYRNFKTRFPGVKNNDFANHNYLITRILGWPKGATF